MAMVRLNPKALISKVKQAIVMTQNRATRDIVISSQHLFEKWGQTERQGTRRTGKQKQESDFISTSVL